MSIDISEKKKTMLEKAASFNSEELAAAYGFVMGMNFKASVGADKGETIKGYNTSEQLRLPSEQAS